MREVYEEAMRVYTERGRVAVLAYFKSLGFGNPQLQLDGLREIMNLRR